MPDRALKVERVAPPAVPWTDLDCRPDRTVFQTLPWLDFLVETQRAEPISARVVAGDETIGWFTGAITRRAGLRVLGSPMRGWTTSYMGFNLDVEVPPALLLGALRHFAFAELGCLHLEVMDRSFDVEMTPPAGFHISRLGSYERRIDVDDDELMAGMKKEGRRDVRRALRNGIVVEEVDPQMEPGFAEEYYEQVLESFGKRALVPTYPLSRVQAAIRHLHPTGHMLLLRARLSDGTPAATGIFPGLPGAAAVFWMGASHRAHQKQLPNEALMWTAMQKWRDRGAVRLDFGGGGAYKAKYGGDPIAVPWLRMSRFGVLEHGRTIAQRAYRVLQQRAGRVSA